MIGYQCELLKKLIHLITDTPITKLLNTQIDQKPLPKMVTNESFHRFIFCEAKIVVRFCRGFIPVF